MNTHFHYSKSAFAAFVAFAFLAMGAAAAEWPDRTTLPIPLPPFEGKTGKTYKDCDAAWQKDIASLQKLLTDWAENHKEVVKKVGWIAGFGYDDSQLAEKRHPTREDLDKVSTDLPVLIIHQSSHLGVANSKALELAGIDAKTQNPKGGVFRRKEGTNEPNGVCEEYAFFAVVSKLVGRFDNPINDALVVEGTKLADIKVLETIKGGKSIYKRPTPSASISMPPCRGLTLDHSPEEHREGSNISGFKPVCGDGCFNHGLSLMLRAIESAADKK